MEGGWVLDDVRYGYIDPQIHRRGRVSFCDSIFFDFRMYSEVDEGGS